MLVIWPPEAKYYEGTRLCQNCEYPVRIPCPSLRESSRLVNVKNVHGSNPVIGKIYIEHKFTVNCIEKTKIKKNEAGNGHFKKTLVIFVKSVTILLLWRFSHFSFSFSSDFIFLIVAFFLPLFLVSNFYYKTV